MSFKSLSLISALLIAFSVSNLANAQVTLPPGFNQVFVAGGIIGPTTMAIAPDGRFFICQQNGILKVVKHDTILTKPFITLNVNTNGERGLLGVAFDPDFANNQYVYLCYTVASGDYNRVSRFTASGDTVLPGSETLVLQLDSLIANYHGGGHLGFGPDGKLYITAGENGRPLMSQNIDSYLGKILRVNSDGSAPIDNPFPGTGKRTRVWAYGMRNPFTFSFQPNTGKLFVNDVGEITWEEINDVTVGGNNFGWPTAEGMSSDTSFENPFYTYQHGTGPGLGCAITGGTFFNPDSTEYPASYLDHYFYIDYCGNWINMISLTNPPVWSNFGTNIANYSVGILTGQDGNLYYLSRNNQALYKIKYTSVAAPLVVNDPQSQTISLNFPVTFSVNASGAMPLSYQWRKGNVPIAGANSLNYTIPSVLFSDSGNYNVIVTNANGADTSNDAHLTVVANQPPQAVIDTPSTNACYQAGDVIYFHGLANDPEDGALPDSLFEWVVEFHHDTHFHPGPSAGSGISSGTFIIPTVGEVSPNVFYRLILNVHDTDGATTSTYFDIHPCTSTFIINTQPPGLTVYVDGQPFTSPDSVLGVEGMQRTISVPYAQMVGPTPVYFTHWSSGAPLSYTITTPVNDSTWTAHYDSVFSLPFTLGPDTIVCPGSTVVLDAGNYSTYAWTDGTVNQNLSVHSSVITTLSVGVTVTDGLGNSGIDSINVIFDCTDISTVQKESIKIYPIPSDGDVMISEQPDDYYLNVIDMTGRLILNNELIHSHHSKNVHLMPGVYSFLFMGNDKHLIFHKEVIILG